MVNGRSIAQAPRFAADLANPEASFYLPITGTGIARSVMITATSRKQSFGEL